MSSNNYPTFAGYKRVETPNGFLGDGNWGRVWLYEGSHGNKFAVKEQELTLLAQSQKAARNWDKERLVENDSLKGNSNAYPGLAFTFVGYDREGKPYLFIEPVDRFLDSHLDGRTLTPKEAIPIMQGMAAGLNSLHTHIGRIHGDLHPKNIGYAEDGLVKIIDFGSSTDGNEEIENLGHPLVRAPERFFKDKIRPASDVWSFGANVYRFFNPQFPFEAEFYTAENAGRDFTEIMRAYYASPTTWNDIIDGKVRRLNSPKAFKTLLEHTLGHELTRIPNGAALEEEIARTIRRYEKTLWPSRARRFAGVALALAAAIGIGYTAIQQRTEKQGLEIKLAKSQEELRLEQKLGVVKAYRDESITLQQSWGKFLFEGTLKGWLDMFEDPLTGIAAYLDAEPHPFTIVEAIHMAQGKKDWTSLKAHVERINPAIYREMEKFTRNDIDGFTYLAYRENRKNVKSTWEEAERRFQARNMAFAAASRDHTSVVPPRYKVSGGNSDPLKAELTPDSSRAE